MLKNKSIYYSIFSGKEKDVRMGHTTIEEIFEKLNKLIDDTDEGVLKVFEINPYIGTEKLIKKILVIDQLSLIEGESL